MIQVREETPEVFYPAEEFVTFAANDWAELKRRAMLNSRKRMRLCAHRSPQATLQEMFIVLAQDSYIRPHKHRGKSESLAILEGEADIIFFDEAGGVRKVLTVGAPASGKCFYYRLDEPIYHMLLIRTEFLVIHEVTEGPFLREQTEFPSWAPAEHDTDLPRFLLEIKKALAC